MFRGGLAVGVTALCWPCAGGRATLRMNNTDAKNVGLLAGFTVNLHVRIR
jgi:hypothetical protein